MEVCFSVYSGLWRRLGCGGFGLCVWWLVRWWEWKDVSHGNVGLLVFVLCGNGALWGVLGGNVKSWMCVSCVNELGLRMRVNGFFYRQRR